jgi:hypothetical protein
MRACGFCFIRRASPFKSEDMETVARPGVPGQEGPRGASVCDRRRRGSTRAGEPEVVFCLDEFGALNLQPHPGRQWAQRGGRHQDPERGPRRRRRATYNRPHGVRHLFAAFDLATDRLYGHVKPTKTRTKFTSSALTCVASTRNRCGWRSSATSSPRT